MSLRKNTSAHTTAALIKAVEMLPELEASAKERQIWGRWIDDIKGKGKASHQAGKLCRVNSTYIEKAKSMAVNRPDLFQLMKDGEITFVEASKIMEGKTELRCEYFYLMLVSPDLSNKRVKLGRSSYPPNRCKQFSGVCPTIELVKSWEIAEVSWEPRIMDTVTHDCVQLNNEVYDISVPLEEFIERIDEFVKELKNDCNDYPKG